MQSTNQTIVFNNERVNFSVSPCSWMYPDSGLEISLSVKENAVNAECEFVADKSFDAMNKPMQLLDAAAKVMAEKWLAENGTSPLHEKLALWKAMSDALRSGLAKAQKRQDELQKRRDQDHKVKGYTHRVNAWVHPQHGDDYMKVAYYAGNPDKAAISKLLKFSSIKNDYSVTEL